MTAPEIDGWEHFYSGKVRDLYHPRVPTSTQSIPAIPGAAAAFVHGQQLGEILVLSSNRVSAFDHILDPEIPNKGAMLTQLSRWWFKKLSHVPNHLVDHLDERLTELPEDIRDRAMIVKRLDMFPIEAVVRQFVTGSGYKEYLETGTISGVALPEGLKNGDRLPEPIYTPAWKAPVGEHDENISFERTFELVGADAAKKIKEFSLEIFQTANAIVQQHGLLLADTKFEFGFDPDSGKIMLADEVLTSDSSRYWEKSAWDRDGSMESFDKQIVRNWLSDNWNGEGTPPSLPESIVQETSAKYRDLYERLSQSN